MPDVERVRAHYTALCAAAVAHFGSASLAGRLLLVDGITADGDALLLAASIAGAASLVLETQTDAIRYCVRNGIVDFAVTTLDEALRILKNEIRKQQPIAVLLEQPSGDALAAMVERGAQPEMLRVASEDRAVETLRDRGALPVPFPAVDASAGRSEVCWRAGNGGSAALRQLDLLAGQTLLPEDVERQNWIARAPRYLPRALRRERCVRMSQPEYAAFMTALEESVQQKTLAARVEVEFAGAIRLLGADVS